MKSLKVFFLLAMLLAFAVISLSSVAPSEEEKEESFIDNNDGTTDDNSEIPWTESQELTTSSLRGFTNRFLAQNSREVMTCDKYPRVCREKGSPGPDCCKKKCVKVMTDKLNCGKCGKKCSYPEICCKGVCVNPMNNKKHCGGCNNKCKKGNDCVYGMCRYA